MMERAQAELLLRKLYAARAAGRLEELCGCFADEASFRISGATDGKAIAVASQGIDEIRTWLATLVKAFKVTDQQILTMIVDGAQAAVHWRANIKSRITGAVVLTELIDLVEFRGGRIGSYSEFFMPVSR